ncbi:hypothetical protein [Nocardia tengchongensis]
MMGQFLVLDPGRAPAFTPAPMGDMPMGDMSMGDNGSGAHGGH